MAKCKACGEPIPAGQEKHDVHSGGTVIPWILVGPYHQQCAPRRGSASSLFTPGAMWFAFVVIVVCLLWLLVLR